MIWVALIAGAVLTVLLQIFSVEKAMAAITADRIPERLLVEQKEPVDLEIALQNRSFRLIPFVQVRCRAPLGEEIGFSAWLGPRHKLHRRVALTFSRRGRYVLGDLQVSCGDFLGLREQEAVFGSFREIVVPPQPLEAPQLDVLMGGFLGDVSARRFILEDPVLTLGYREYTGADPMKRISWTQSARHNTLMVKKNDYTVEPSVSVILNVHSDADKKEEKLESCCRAARSVCAALEKAGVHYNFATNAQLLGSRAANSGADGLGNRHFSAILESLGRACGTHTVSLERLLEKELQRPGQHGRVLITPGGSEEETRQLQRLREAGSLLVITAAEVAQWQ